MDAEHIEAADKWLPVARAALHEDDDTTETEGWKGITDDALASWALEKMRGYLTERDRIRNNAQALIDQIQADALADEKPLTDKIDWFTSELIAYYRSLPDPPKTYKLPNGKIAHRAGRASVTVLDLERFAEWAQESCPAAVKVEPRVSALSDMTRTPGGGIIDPDGQEVPGVHWVPGTPSVSVTVADRVTP